MFLCGVLIHLVYLQCDKLCGDGLQKRDVKCYYKLNGKVSIANDSACLDPKPDAQKACFLRPCEGVDWIVSQWSGVS